MANAVVVGGGVIGLSVAWRAAQRGLTVTVADPAPARGASHVAAGMLTPVSEAAYHEKELLRLGVASLERYPGFVAELASVTGAQAGFRQTGTLQVGYDADDLAVIGELHVMQQSLGVGARPLTARECRELEPMLDPSVRGGLLVEGDGSVDPRLLTRALLAAVRRCGVRVIRQPVTGITPPGTAGRSPAVVRLADGAAISADQVVLAAGWRSAHIAGLPPECLPPVRPVKGQILRLRATGADGAQILPSRSVRGIVRGSSVYLVPRESGELVVGATQEEMGTDTRVTAGGVWELLRDARALVPGITELQFAEATAALRPGTPDNAPVLGPSGTPGVVLATGHFRHGVLLAPITADIIAGYLECGSMPEAGAHFTIERFRRGGMRS